MTNEFGKVEIHHPKCLIAGQIVCVEFDFEVGSRGMSEGASLRIGLPSVAWGRPEVPQYYFWSEYARGKDRVYTQYDRVNTTVRLETSGDAVPLLETEARFYKPFSHPPRWLTEYDRWWLMVTLEDSGLAPGDHIIVTYGDPAQLPLTARVQGFPEKRVNFLVFVAPDGSGDFRPVEGSPWMTEVRAGSASRIDVIAPCIIRPDETLELRVAYTDAVKAAPQTPPAVATLRVQVEGQNSAARQQRVNRNVDALRVKVPQLQRRRSSQRPLHVTVNDPRRAWSARSNPILVRARGPRLFWGDLHAQSQYHGWSEEDQKGMSCHLPEQCYRYARDVAGLDFCAVTDTRSIAASIWRDTIQQADAMYEPGRFVTFHGSEVGGDSNGHRNLLFAGSTAEPGISATTLNQKGTNFVELETPHMQKRYAGRRDVMLVPHHVKMWMTWDCYDAELEPVLEIYSIWGSGEKAGTDRWEILREMTGGAQEAWARGYRIGVIAGSDTHAGLPGRSIPRCDRDDFMPYPAGLAGVWADELTRQAIFDALSRRHCYGTTGVRIILETFIDEHPMGSDVRWPKPKTPRRLRIRVWGTDVLETVTVVKNNEDVHTFDERSSAAQLEWEDKSRAQHGDFYYVRVTQRDGNRAWSSPIWLDV